MLQYLFSLFNWDRGNDFVWGGRCKDWRAIAPQVGVSKNPWFQEKHRGILAHWIWPRFLSKHFISLLTQQPDVFYRLIYQSRASKHKKWKELDCLKLYLKVIKLSKYYFYQQSAAPQQVRPGPRVPLLRHCRGAQFENIYLNLKAKLPETWLEDHESKTMKYEVNATWWMPCS